MFLSRKQIVAEPRTAEDTLHCEPTEGDAYGNIPLGMEADVRHVVAAMHEDEKDG